MNKQIGLTFSLLMLLFCGVQAQVKFSSGAKPIVKEKVFYYDSTRNFVGEDVKSLKGQELYVIPRKPELHEYGYRYFFDTYGLTTTLTEYNQTYELYAGRIFIVEDVLPEHPNQWIKTKERSILKLRDKESGRECYYAYDFRFIHSYPFIVMGFYEKEKRNGIGKQIVLKPGKNWREKPFKEDEAKPMYDFKTGQEVKVDPNEPWTVEDLTVEDQYYTLSYVIRNAKGETLTIGIIDVNDYQRNSTPCALFLNDTLNTIKTKQPEYYNAIMHSRIKLGMTPTMVRYAWGAPDNIVNSSEGTIWYYTPNSLYFKDGVLESF